MKPRNQSWDSIEGTWLKCFYSEHRGRIDAMPFESRDSSHHLVSMLNAFQKNPITDTCYRFLSLLCIVFVPNSPLDHPVWGTHVSLGFPAKMYSGSKDYWSIYLVSGTNEIIERWQVEAMDFEGVAQKVGEVILDVRKEQK